VHRITLPNLIARVSNSVLPIAGLPTEHAMHDVYPAGPASVPADLTRPSTAYRRHAYLAVAGLFVFLALYFALAGWFGWTAYRSLTALDEVDNIIGPILVGVCAGFLALFMVTAIFFVRRGEHGGELEITADDHPLLFGFLHRIADEAGAPRPHRVFLSPRVNAGVSYDLSIANLIFPSKKNLEIGLGLVNVLTLCELKAVLAHEFGHFAQRTMAVGRWVYMAQQIAGHIVVRRGAFDRFLQRLSSFDLRVAWIGWLLRLVVWSIRSLVDSVFGWVVMAQRALSREMELQADLVAVSLTGSDALIHALHRLDGADDALDRALSFVGSELRAGRRVADVFAVQSRMLERKRVILADPHYGLVPPLPAAPADHRLFTAKLAQPPRMWSTHPANHVREDNAKRVYVAGSLDERSGWLLFADPAAIRARVTASLYPADQEADEVPLDHSLTTLDQRFELRSLDPAYRGVYLGRSVVRAAARLDDLYGALPDPAELARALEELYPASLQAELASLRELDEERAMLEALHRGVLEAPGGVVQCRGQQVHRRALPALLGEVERDLTAARQRVLDHDRRVRTAHLAAARAHAPGWEAELRGLLAVLHYADHREADLEDAMGSLDHVFAIITADRKITASEIERLVVEAAALYAVLQEIHQQADQLVLGATLAGALEVASWSDALGELELPGPDEDNIGQWLDAAQSWIGAASGALSALGGAALDALLAAEEQIALHARSGQPMPEPPSPTPRPPGHYAVLLPGSERPRQARLGWWDRFQVADGAVAATLRFAVAASMVGAVLWLGW
jgi:Zn-dependent protease with chaperone function